MIHGVIFSKDGPIVCHDALELATANGDLIIVAPKEETEKLRKIAKRCLNMLTPK